MSENKQGTPATPTPGQVVYEAWHAAMRRRFPGIAEIRWDELSGETQAEWEDIARAGIAAYIEANRGDPVDAASVIAEVIAPELAGLRKKVAEYENGITWGTTCLSCAAVLDSSIAETFRWEKAEADRDALCAELAGTRQRLGDLAADLERSAKATEPSKKSDIEMRCAEAVRQIAGTP